MVGYACVAAYGVPTSTATDASTTQVLDATAADGRELPLLLYGFRVGPT